MYRQVINNAINKANITVNENDYIGKDGLLYCGNCHTQKQGEYTMPWGVVRPYLLCECLTKERDRLEEKHKNEQRMFKERERLSYLRSNGLLESSIGEVVKMICPEAKAEIERICFPSTDIGEKNNLRNWTFENAEITPIIEAMKKYVDFFDEMKETGQGFLLFGETSRGKSYAAISAANALLDKGYSVLVTNFTIIANTVGGIFAGKQKYYDSLNCFDLLILDDLGAERKTEYMQEIVWNVIDNRYRSGLPMIITTNLTSEKLKKPQEVAYKRIYDRALEVCLPVEVTGKNRRHAKTAEKYAVLKERFGL